MPTTEAFGEGVIVTTDAKNYTANDWPAFFGDLGHTQANDITTTLVATETGMAQLGASCLHEPELL